MKWYAIVSGWVLVALALSALVFSAWVNPRVVRELRENPQADRAAKVMVLTLPSGRTFPVNYLREGNIVYAGADFPWWRELRGEGAQGSVVIRGETFSGSMRAVEDNPDLRNSVFDRLRPTAPRWWGVLVEIRLDAE